MFMGVVPLGDGEAVESWPPVPAAMREVFQYVRILVGTIVFPLKKPGFVDESGFFRRSLVGLRP
jgi:hypothetical protein